MSAWYWLAWLVLTLANAALLYGHFRLWRRVDDVFARYQRSVAMQFRKSPSGRKGGAR